MKKPNLSDMIRLSSNVSNRKLEMLTDSEADISLIKVNALQHNFILNEKENMILRGITDGRVKTLGTVLIELDFNNIIMEHKFHVVDHKFDIPTNGLLGKDFIKTHGCILDYRKMEMRFEINNFEVKTKIYSEVADGKSAVPSNGGVFKIFRIKESEFPRVIEPQEIAKNIFIPTTIIYEPESWIRVINLNDTNKIIDTSNVSSKPLRYYDVLKSTGRNKIENERANELEQFLASKIPEHAKSSLIPLCREFNDIFHLPNDRLTTNNFYEQQLHVSDESPVYVKNYRLPQSQKLEINSQVEKLLRDDLIEMSVSAYNAPLIIVPKKSQDGNKKWRLCVDYRLLNKKLLPDKFPLNRIDEILDSLGKAQFFSVLDLQSGYHQIPLHPDSRHITAFSTERGMYQWKVLPFGINIAPASFSRMMKIAFSGLSQSIAFTYMDDLIVVGCSEKQHIRNLTEVFKSCRKHNLKLNPQKSEFFRAEVNFLGHKCTKHGLLPDPQKIKAVEKYPRPTDKDAAKRFVAFANYYRRFIRNFADLAHPISSLTKKSVKFIWTDACEKSFIQLKNALISPPILKYPDFEKEFKVIVDASSLGCGGVLTQSYNGVDMPVTYVSKTFKKGEINKPVIEKELIAIHFALTTLRPYLYGRKFVVKSDHKPLIYLYNLRNPASKLTRLRLDIEEFNFDIEYIKGSDNVVADALSRIPFDKIKDETAQILAVKTRSMTKGGKIGENNEEKVEEIEIERPKCIEEPMSFFTKKIPRLRVVEIIYAKNDNKSIVKLVISGYQNHKCLFELTIENKNKEKIKLGQVTSGLESIASNLGIDQLQWPVGDVFFEECYINDFKRSCEKQFKKLQIVLTRKQEVVRDKNRQLELMEFFHGDKMYGGHVGQKKLYAKLRARYFWKNMTKDIATFVRNCNTCKFTKHQQRTKEKMTITDTPIQSFEEVVIDTVGPLPKSPNGNTYIVTAMCELTKYLIAIPLADKTANTMADAIFKKVILIHGPMKQLKSDCGTEYKNKVIADLCKLLRVKQKTSTSHHHETLGTVERGHNTMNAYMRAYSKENHDWEEYLEYFVFCYNTNTHASFEEKYSPFQLIYGKKPFLPEDFQSELVNPVYNHDDYIKMLQYRLHTANKQAREILMKMKHKSKNQYDKRAKPLSVSIGTRVKLFREPYDKKSNVYDGPYIIIDISHPNVTMKHEKTNKVKTVHKDRIEVL